MKIVLNKCYGGFSLSPAAQAELGVDTPHPDLPRNDPRLVAMVEKLGEAANSEFADLRVVETHERWRIREYDGYEALETESQLLASLEPAD